MKLNILFVLVCDLSSGGLTTTAEVAIFSSAGSPNCLAVERSTFNEKIWIVPLSEEHEIYYDKGSKEMQ